MNRLQVFVVAAVCCFSARLVGAPIDLAEQVRAADAVYLVRVAAMTPFAQGGGILTRVQFEVLKPYKGEGRELLTLNFLGGTIGERTIRASSVPMFSLGERYVLFVSSDRNSVSPLVGGAKGAYHVDAAGQVADVNLRGSSAPIALSDLEAEIRSLVNEEGL